jgi:hypothetical protein
VPKEGKSVEQAFQACVKDHQKITGLQPPRYVLGSNLGMTFSRAASSNKNFVIPNRAESPVRNLL